MGRSQQHERIFGKLLNALVFNHLLYTGLVIGRSWESRKLRAVLDYGVWNMSLVWDTHPVYLLQPS